jgi:hypothetical protein
MRWIIIVPLFVVFAVVATYARYQSFDTCRWLVIDTAEYYDLSETAAEAHARADLLLHGVVSPDAFDCMHAWWRARRHVPLPRSPRASSTTSVGRARVRRGS